MKILIIVFSLSFFILLLAVSGVFLKNGYKEKFNSDAGPEKSLSKTTTSTVEVMPEDLGNIVNPLKLSGPLEVKKEISISSPAENNISSPNKISTASTSLATTTRALTNIVTTLPPLDEANLLKAVVKIQCPASDGLGKYIGSGFVFKGGIVATAAHVIKDSASSECEIIFPHERRPIHYLRGKIENLKEVIRRHDEEGIDLAVLKLPDLSAYPEAKEIFNEYPFIPYPVCENPAMLGDELLHFGYPSNYADQNYLSEQKGKAVVYADIGGIKEALSEDQTFTYKTPIFSSSYDESRMHPYMVSRVASFYGDSGGLAFNETKQCVLGPHRGGTIGKSNGENYSVFMLMGWDKVN